MAINSFFLVPLFFFNFNWFLFVLFHFGLYYRFYKNIEIAILEMKT